LLELRPDEAVTAVEDARRLLAEAETALQSSRTNYLKHVQRLEGGEDLAAEVSATERALRTAEEGRALAAETLERAQSARLDGILYAPGDATVEAILVQSNQAVTAGQPVIKLRR